MSRFFYVYNLWQLEIGRRNGLSTPATREFCVGGQELDAEPVGPLRQRQPGRRQRPQHRRGGSRRGASPVPQQRRRLHTSQVFRYHDTFSRPPDFPAWPQIAPGPDGPRWTACSTSARRWWAILTMWSTSSRSAPSSRTATAPPPRWRSHCAGSAPGCSSLPDACCSSGAVVSSAGTATPACHGCGNAGDVRELWLVPEPLDLREPCQIDLRPTPARPAGQLTIRANNAWHGGSQPDRREQQPLDSGRLPFDGPHASRDASRLRSAGVASRRLPACDGHEHLDGRHRGSRGRAGPAPSDDCSASVFAIRRGLSQGSPPAGLASRSSSRGG